MNFLPNADLIAFPLSPDLHHELGWTETVQRITCENPAVIRHLLQIQDSLPLGEDPATVLQTWWPSAGFMVYFVRRRSSQSRSEFVVSDGVFTVSFPSNGAGQFDGLVALILDRAVAACTTACRNKPIPFFPDATGLPEAVIVHRLRQADAIVSPYDIAVPALLKKEAL